MRYLRFDSYLGACVQCVWIEKIKESPINMHHYINKWAIIYHMTKTHKK